MNRAAEICSAVVVAATAPPLHDIEPPRWRGGPPICEATNRLAFESQKEARDFYESNCPGYGIKSIDPCSRCGGFHTETVAPGPAGMSSGTDTRPQTLHVPPEVEAHNLRMTRKYGARWDAKKKAEEKRRGL